MTLSSLAATLAVALPFGGTGVTLQPYDNPAVCGMTEEPIPSVAAGCVFSREPMTVYCHRPHCGDEWLIAHELGHVLDFAFMTESRRTRLEARVGVTWHPERFAEYYAACGLRTIIRGEYFGAWLDPFSARGRRVCTMIRYWTRITSQSTGLRAASA